MAEITCRQKWQDAYEKAGFYKSSTNSREYWDKTAESDGGSLNGKKHIDSLKDYLIALKLIGEHSTVLDIGCGCGEYVREFAGICSYVTALDYSEKMLSVCKERCLSAGADNVSYILADFMEYDLTEKYDCIIACLNPVTYQPDAFDKMLSLSLGTVVYFSMDTPIDSSDTEPVYHGCNSVRYAEEYLKEKGIYYRKIPYTYEHIMNDGKIRKIDFAYLVIVKGDNKMNRDQLYDPGEEVIETDRLIMRRLRPDDYLAMSAWDMDERVYKYLMSSACKTIKEPLVWLPKKDPRSKINILMLVIDKEDGHAVGTYALNHVIERDVWTVSYVNRYDDWGKGYTTEGMKAFIDHAVKVYGAHSFEGECAKENAGSARVLQKLGMVYDHSSSYSKNDGSASFESDVYILEIGE